VVLQGDVDPSYTSFFESYFYGILCKDLDGCNVQVNVVSGSITLEVTATAPKTDDPNSGVARNTEAFFLSNSKAVEVQGESFEVVSVSFPTIAEKVVVVAVAPPPPPAVPPACYDVYQQYKDGDCCGREPGDLDPTAEQECRQVKKDFKALDCCMATMQAADR